MPAKRAAKKTARKMVKKPGGARGARELRWAYEHLGRVDILEGALAGERFVQVTELMKLARERLAAGEFRDGADLLRAAEHISFAALAPEERPGMTTLVSMELKTAIEDEMERRRRDAREHWSQGDRRDASVASIYASVLEGSRGAMRAGVYRPALELARAAEALAKIGEGARRVGVGGQRERLAS